MQRRSFFGMLLGWIATAVLAPKVVRGWDLAKGESRYAITVHRDGVLVEAMEFDERLTEADRRKIVAYLRQRWMA